MFRRLMAIAGGALALTAATAGSAAAHPAATPGLGHAQAAGGTHLHGLTWRFVGATTAPPTTAQCLAAIGIACYSPGQLETAYDMRRLYAAGDSGQGRTIVLFDSFGSPTIAADLRVFDRQFHLPAPPSLRVLRPVGPVPPFDGSNSTMVGWAFESTLDVEYAHAMAPRARIVLVETPVAETEGITGMPQLMRAENLMVDRGIGDVFSQSFGATEQTFRPQTLLNLRYAFENAARHHVTVLASSGDSGSANYKLNGVDLFRYPTVGWPSSDPLVTSVGGTQLHLNAAGHRTAPDNVWNDIPIGIDAAGGGGPSHVFARPAYQRKMATGAGPFRATPDISMSAAVDGGALVYLSFPGLPAGFYIVGGTSEASPLFAGVVAIADQIAGHRLGQINPSMYAMRGRPGSGIVDIRLGNNTFTLLDGNNNPVFVVPGWQAARGYDMASGLGTVDGYTFAHALAR
ncbi:MAG TPA: S53 family peptidase [Gaiellales bacterium]|nr:S53 family peptidase [Gaiellales bacterium]